MCFLLTDLTGLSQFLIYQNWAQRAYFIILATNKGWINMDHWKKLIFSSLQHPVPSARPPSHLILEGNSPSSLPPSSSFSPQTFCSCSSCRLLTSLPTHLLGRRQIDTLHERGRECMCNLSCIRFDICWSGCTFGEMVRGAGLRPVYVCLLKSDLRVFTMPLSPLRNTLVL